MVRLFYSYKDALMSQNASPRQITVAEMAPHVHSFLPGENKANKIFNWLSDWIRESLAGGKIKPNDFLPPKGDLACHIGVSLGTMQNVFRMIEDIGLVESKQKIGTYIKAPDTQRSEKLTSKRDSACEIIKSYIIENKFKIGDRLLSTRKLSSVLNIPSTTVRIALNKLITEKIVEKQDKLFVIKNLNFKINKNETKTLVDKIAERINKYIKTKLKPGDKLPASSALADMYNVSIKTIHDAIFILSVAGIVKTRRGYYGTIVSDKNENENLYFYEQVLLKIKKYIADNCKPNDKLPTIKEFSEVFSVSTKTIKKALDNLAEDGYITFSRGRMGGTFVIDIPIISDSGYTWLALSPEFEEKFN